MKKVDSIHTLFPIHFKFEIKPELISVIVPVFKDLKGLTDTLNSLKNQTINNTKYEIIVANDGNDPHISTVCKSHSVKEIKISANLGSYNARNKALEQSRGEYIAFTDADVIVQNNWLEKGIEELENSDYVGGKITIDKTKVKSIANLYDYHFAFKVKDYINNDHFAPTANLFVKRSVFEKVGVFDESLHSGGDLEFGNRVFLANKFSQLYSEKIEVIHPPRNYNYLRQKIIRVTKGHKVLERKFPERFSKSETSLKSLFIQLSTPPQLFYKNQNFITNIQLFFFSWWIRTLAIFTQKSL